MAHWRDRDLDDPTRDAVVGDWLDVIGDYPLWAVHHAAAEWLSTQRYRPVPADIRALCESAVRQDAQTLVALRKLAGDTSREIAPL